MKPYYSKPMRILITSLSILAGNALLGFLVAAFILPHDIVMGGTTGIGIILAKVIPGMDVSFFILAMNLLLLIFGLFVLGKKLFFTTAASSVLYPGFLALFQRIPGIDTLVSKDNPLLAAIFAGLLLGIALGLVMRVGSSTGGMDILDLACSKWTHLPVEVFVYIGDLLIIGGQMFQHTPEQLLLGILVLMLETLFLGRTMLLGKAQMQVMVVSRKAEEIREAILNEVVAGATMFFIETGRLKKKEKAVLSVIPERKLYQTTEQIRSIDPKAFIMISKINEVRGQGFTWARKELAEAPSEPDPAVPADGQSE